jgi:hypothetical protein
VKRMPLWFRVAVCTMFAVLLVPFVLLHSGSGRNAMADALARSFGVEMVPMLATQAMLPGAFQFPADGSYSINGMPVEYHTYPVLHETAQSIVGRFQHVFEKSGFQVKLVPTEGSPTLVGIHPDTKMMLTVRPVRDSEGTPGIRLTQQDLSKFDPKFDARIADLPVYPRATQRILISSIEGTHTRSLTYQAPGSAAMVEQFYRDEMHAEGWRRFDPPARLPPGNPVALFFERDGVESSLLIAPQEGSSSTFVMITLTGDPANLS